MHIAVSLIALPLLCASAAYYGRRPVGRFGGAIAIMAAVVILLGFYVVRG